MKKQSCLWLLLLVIVSASCSKQHSIIPDIDPPIPEDNSKEDTKNEDSVERNPYRWEESFRTSWDFLLRRGGNKSSEFVVTSPNIYVGAIYEGNSINDLTLRPIKARVEPIIISYYLPSFFCDTIVKPSQKTMQHSIRKAVVSPEFSGNQSVSFEYDYKRFEYYNELKLAFGANVNITDLFSIENQRIKHKSGLMARIIQKNFSVVMDYPDTPTIFANQADFEKYKATSPVYVNSISYGRLGIVMIESDYSYEELKKAFKAALKLGGKGATATLDSESLKVLENAQVKLFISGGKSKDVAKIVDGFHEFRNFIIEGATFTQDVPGVPIYFTANVAATDEVFFSTFEI